jgi:hypothetical protein
MKTRLQVALVIFLTALQFSPCGLRSGKLRSHRCQESSRIHPAPSIENATVQGQKQRYGRAIFNTKTASQRHLHCAGSQQRIYSVTISAPGLQAGHLTGVKVDAGAAASVRVSLEVGATTEAITVQEALKCCRPSPQHHYIRSAAREIQSLRSPLEMFWSFSRSCPA